MNIFPKLESKIGVYLIVSPSNGRYVGSSKRLDKRFNRYKNLSCTKQKAIYASLNKYGVDAHKFSVLIYCDEVDLFFWERVFGDIYRASANFKNGLNLSLPSYDDVPVMITNESRISRSLAGKKRFENIEERRKVGEKSRLAYSNTELRKMVSEIHKIRCNTTEFKLERSLQQKTYFTSPEARKRTSDGVKKYLLNNPEQKEKNYSALTKFYENNPEKRGIYLKELHKNNPTAGKEHGEKLVKLYRDNPHLREVVAEKTRKQIAENGHPFSKPVINTETGEIHPHLRGLAQSLKIPVQTFRNWLKGKSTNKTPYRFLETQKTA